MVAASAKAAMKPNAGCTGSNAFAPMKIANVAASTDVASSFTRRNSAARAASPGVSMTKVPGSGHDGFRRTIDPHARMSALPSFARRSEAVQSRRMTPHRWHSCVRDRRKSASSP